MHRNFPYAYRSLQDALSELKTHFTRVGITSELTPLDQNITIQTPVQLTQLLESLKVEHTALHPRVGEALDFLLADNLLERFISDASTFTVVLQHEIDVHSVGLVDYLNGDM